ncbi:MAG: ImmA/IrrE family metallo-endopeptidase [Tissierellia bacterium]|nr:ImmA/IrrE family metallo-endopeptidase [Tissierellia bacterium]
MKKMAIKLLASSIYNHHKTVNPFEVCKALDIETVFIPMPLKLKGYTTEKYRVKLIYINNRYPEVEQQFICLHELGHILCKHEDNILFNQLYTYHRNSKEENEANIFATYFILSKYSAEQLSGFTVSQISQLTGIDEKHLYLIYD